MARVSLSYVALGLRNDFEVVVPGATVTFYEADGTTLLAQTLWNQPTGGSAQANPTTTGSNGATPTFWLDFGQTVTVKWTATGWTGVTESLSLGGASGGTPPDGSITTPKLAANAVTSAKVDATILTSSAVIDNLADVQVTSVADLDWFQYDTASGKWTNRRNSRAQRTFQSFSGQSGSSTLANQIQAISNFIAWSKTIRGGTLVFESEDYPSMPNIELWQYGAVVGGPGLYQARLIADSTLATHFITNHQATSITRTGDPTSGSAVIANFSNTTGVAAGMPVSGTGIPGGAKVLSVGSGQITLTANATATNTGVTLTITDSFNAEGIGIRNLFLDMTLVGGWGSAAVDAIHLTQTTSNDGQPLNNSPYFDPDPKHYIIDNYITHPPRDGVNMGGRGGHIMRGTQVYSAGRFGFQPTTDSEVHECTSAFAQGHGFSIITGPIRLSGCKSYASGNGTDGSAGDGFHIGPIAGSVGITNCEAQDNNGAGFNVQNSTGVGFSDCWADSNSVGTLHAGPTYPGWILNNAPKTTLANCRTFERNAIGHNQVNAISVTNSPGCHLDIQHYYKDDGHGGTASVSSPFESLDTTPGMVVNINSLLGMQLPAFAASYTPDFFAGGKIKMVLTANIVVNAPSNGPYPVGTEVVIELRQNATGGWTITWDSAYSTPPATVTAANGYTIGRFIWDGSIWSPEK